MLLQVLLDVPLLQDEVEALHGVNDVLRVVISVLLEVALVDLVREVNKPVNLDVELFEEAVLLEHLVSEVLEAMFAQYVFKLEGVKGSQVQSGHVLFQMLNLDELLQLDNLKEVGVKLLELKLEGTLLLVLLKYVRSNLGLEATSAHLVVFTVLS